VLIDRDIVSILSNFNVPQQFNDLKGLQENYMSSDLFDALTVSLIVTVFSCLMSPTLVWLFTAQQQG
jgi:hypothetical protein